MRPPDFLRYLRALYRRKWTIVVVTVVAVGAAIGFSESVKPSYTGTAKVLLGPSNAQTALSNGASTAGTSPNNIEDQIAVLTGPSVASLVRQKLGSSPPVSASNETNTDIIDVSVSSHSPALAARAANAYANGYVSFERTQDVDQLLSAASTIQGRISALQQQISGMGAGSPEATALQQQVVVLEQQLSTLQSDAALGSAGASVVQPATPPRTPSSPKKTLNGLVGLLGGLVLGTALAFVRESLDDTIVGREDVSLSQPELPVLALIPQYSVGRHEGGELVSASRPHSDAAESYRTLRTSVEFTALDRSISTLQLTSPRSTEGKTTTAANLVVTLAKVGREVVVVDCDLRRSCLHTLFGLGNEVGFTSVLLGEVPLSAALLQVPDVPGLRLLASGPRPPNPSELLASQRAGEVIASLADLADIVVFDSPPVLPVTDAVALASRVDALLMVVQAGSTTAKDLGRALEMLGQVDASVIGAVLNGVQPRGRYGYRYGRYSYRYGEYSYGYGTPPGDGEREGNRSREPAEPSRE
jgi:capsular exopolysaccharide synthesis family protein